MREKIVEVDEVKFDLVMKLKYVEEECEMFYV